MAIQIFRARRNNAEQPHATPFEDIARDVGLPENETWGVCERYRAGKVYLCELGETESSYSSYSAWEGV